MDIHGFFSGVQHILLTSRRDVFLQYIYKHIGMYAYRYDVLERLTRLSISSLEKAESLEQLRWLENGFKISVAETLTETMGIDTPEDLQKALQGLK